MTNTDLSKDCFIRVCNRAQSIKTLLDLKSFPDVIRETQEDFELLLKGYLRLLRIDPPKWHDVGTILVNNQNLISKNIIPYLDQIVSFSKYLRKERENAFCGDDDLIPLATYTEDEARSCIEKLNFYIKLFEPEF